MTVAQYGPVYPDLGASVAKFRRIKNPTREQRAAHADAIEKAIRAKQRSALLAYPGKVRRARTAEEWPELYEQAMRGKNR